MKRKIFDKNLFLEGMRELRLPSLLLLLFLGMECVLIPVGRFLNNEGFIGDLDMLGINPGAYLLIAAAPFMVIELFRFLTRRSASDFYHAIPQTRVCLYVSYMAAILAWCMILQWGSSVFSVLMHSIFRHYMRVDIRQVLIQNCILSMTVILTMGGAALAVSVTGTILTNIVVTGMLLFGPRLVMLLIQFAVGDCLTVVSGSNYLSFLGNGWNVLTGVVYGVFTGWNVKLLVSWKAGLYTMILGWIYLGIGLFFFHSRKSEKAGQAAVNSGLQLIFRLTPAFLFGLIPDILIFDMMANRSLDHDASTFFTFFVLYLISIVIYFLYELISTRKWRQMIRALNGLPILAAMHLLVIFGMIGMQRQVLSFTPEASEISSVSIEGESSVSFWDEDEYVIYKGYLTSRTEEIELDDPELLQLVSDRLKDGVTYDLDGIYNYSGSTVEKTLNIRCGNRTYTRMLRFTNADVKKISSLLKDHAEYRELFMNLPEVNDPKLRLSSSVDMDEDICREMYEALLEDVQDMGFEAWYSYCMTSYDGYTEFCSLYMIYTENGTTQASVFPISDLTPGAAQIYLDACQAETKTEMETTERILRQMMENTEKYEDRMTINMTEFWYTIYHPKDEANVSSSSGNLLHMADPENIDLLVEVLEEQEKTGSVSVNGEYMQLTIELDFILPQDVDQTAEIYAQIDHYTDPEGDTSYYWNASFYLNLEDLPVEMRDALIELCSDVDY